MELMQYTLLQYYRCPCTVAQQYEQAIILSNMMLIQYIFRNSINSSSVFHCFYLSDKKANENADKGKNK